MGSAGSKGPRRLLEGHVIGVISLLSRRAEKTEGNASQPITNGLTHDPPQERAPASVNRQTALPG